MTNDLAVPPAMVQEILATRGHEHGLDIFGGGVRRSSSRFCLGVEHGDYNGTELFGVGTDRFIWLAFKPNGTRQVRLFSENFPEDGVIQYAIGETPKPRSCNDHHGWGRFPMGVDHVLRQAGHELHHGFDAVLYGNIPGGGMSRSASLTLNLILTYFDVHGIDDVDGMTIVDLAQSVENDYIGSPCGKLDQIMILFAKAGMGTYYHPATRSIEYVPLGEGAIDFRIVSLDTGTLRGGLESSTYKIRRAECEQLAELAKGPFEIEQLADVKSESLYRNIIAHFQESHPQLCQRLRYVHEAQQRFYEMMDAWKQGDVETVGRIFRADGLGLRDQYQISGPELETMCDIARTVPGVLGERMLGGGDKGAAGALVRADAINSLRAAVDRAYPLSRPELADRYAVHVCQIVDGIQDLEGIG